MGEMVAAIAHQWKQPLSVLALILQDLEDAQQSGELDEAYLKNNIEQSLYQIGFMTQTIDDFRNFLRPSKTRVPFDVRHEAQEVGRLFGQELRKAGIALEFSAPESESLMALGFPNEFKQVLLNLINNGRDSILTKNISGGRIMVSVDETESSIRIRVEDNGGGIPPEMLQMLFTPYSTSKGEKGTGIGLYLSKTIIEDSMEGRIEGANHPGGALFTIFLPKAQTTLPETR